MNTLSLYGLAFLISCVKFLFAASIMSTSSLSPFEIALCTGLGALISFNFFYEVAAICKELIIFCNVTTYCYITVEEVYPRTTYFSHALMSTKLLGHLINANVRNMLCRDTYAVQ